MIDKGDYWRAWCPHCNSPQIVKVAMLSEAAVQSRNQCSTDRVVQTHICLNERRCQNCKRVFALSEARWAYDRPAMRRDYKALGRLLAVKGKD